MTKYSVRNEWRNAEFLKITQSDNSKQFALKTPPFEIKPVIDLYEEELFGRHILNKAIHERLDHLCEFEIVIDFVLNTNHLNCSKNLTSFSNICRMSSMLYIRAAMRSSPKPKANPE